MRRKLKIAATTGALALALAAPATSASAQANASAATCGPGGPPYVNSQCITQNWAGLLAIGSGPYSEVIAYWKQPSTTVSYGAYEATSVWVGLGGGAAGDPIPVQVGTVMTTGLLGLTTSLKPHYYGVYETPATGGAITISNFTVNPGDQMAASILYIYGGYNLLLDDITTGHYWSPSSIQGNWPLNTAEAIVEAPAYDNGKLFYPLAPFGTVQFTNLYIGGVYALQMVRNGRTLVSTALPSAVVTYHYSS
jgi:peptidase A4-like protein